MVICFICVYDDNDDINNAISGIYVYIQQRLISVTITTTTKKKICVCMLHVYVGGTSVSSSISKPP